MWIKIVIVLAFLGIVASLASSLFFLVKDKGDQRRTVRALTFRIGLSVGLFAFIMLLVAFGLVEPHGLYPAPPGAPGQ